MTECTHLKREENDEEDDKDGKYRDESNRNQVGKTLISMESKNDSNPLDFYLPGNFTSCPNLYLDAFRTLWKNGKLEIPLYSIIFLLAVVGNVLVILTLVRTLGMRTKTNVFLLNLAISDLILAVLCMPFTLIGSLLRNFVFGETMCKLVPFLQATSVATSVWTLVALSIERYYAICHPLRSRRRQTLSHAYHLIGYIWTGGAAVMLPIFILSELQPTKTGHHKCRENWPEGGYERAYNLFLDFLLLVIPLLTLGITYCNIAKTLWTDLGKKAEYENKKSFLKTSVTKDCSHEKHRYADQSVEVVYISDEEVSMTQDPETTCSVKYSVRFSNLPDSNKDGHDRQERKAITRLKFTKIEKEAKDSIIETELAHPYPCLRRTNYERSLRKKQRVIKMLFVVVLEFFICWTPLYVINTLALFWPHLVYGRMGYKTISFCQLLAYTSGCCNPITYCFLNKSFRHSFINSFALCKKKNKI